jgi:hypothetical protein
VDASLAVVATGLAVGAASTLTGLGAGLALPALALAGIPMPAALLSTNLPVAAADAVAAATTRTGVDDVRSPASGDGPSPGSLDARSPAAGDSPPSPGRALARALGLASVGAAGVLAVVVLPSALAGGLLAAALLAALATDAIVRRDAASDALWGLYVGGFGAGTVLLRSLSPHRRAARWAEALARTRRLGACANAGALAVLLLHEGAPDASMWLLAASQGAGAGLACLARRGWPPTMLPRRRTREGQAGMRTGSDAYPCTKFDGTRTGSPTTSTTG